MKLNLILLLLITFTLVGVGLVSAQTVLYRTYKERGIAAFEAGNIPAATQLFQSALAEAQKLKDEGLIADGNTDLGNVYYSAKNFPAAELCFQTAIQIYTKIDGEDGTRAAYPMNNLGLLYTDQKKWDRAEEFLRRTISIREKELGSTDANVGITMINLGKLYSEQDKYVEADAVYTQALQILMAFPDEKDNILMCLHNLALTTESLNSFKRAEASYKMIISINEKTFGSKSKELIPNLTDYSSFLRRIKRNIDANQVDGRIKLIQKSK